MRQQTIPGGQAAPQHAEYPGYPERPGGPAVKRLRIDVVAVIRSPSKPFTTEHMRGAV